MPKVTGKNAVRRATRGYTKELRGCPLVAHRYSSQREDTRALFPTGDKYIGEFTASPIVTSFGLFQANRAAALLSRLFVVDLLGEKSTPMT